MNKPPVIFVVQSAAGPYDEAAAIATLARLTRAMAERDDVSASSGPESSRRGKVSAPDDAGAVGIEEAVAGR